MFRAALMEILNSKLCEASGFTLPCLAWFVTHQIFTWSFFLTILLASMHHFLVGSVSYHASNNRYTGQWKSSDISRLNHFLVYAVWYITSLQDGRSTHRIRPFFVSLLIGLSRNQKRGDAPCTLNPPPYQSSVQQQHTFIIVLYFARIVDSGCGLCVCGGGSQNRTNSLISWLTVLRYIYSSLKRTVSGHTHVRSRQHSYAWTCIIYVRNACHHNWHYEN